MQLALIDLTWFSSGLNWFFEADKQFILLPQGEIGGAHNPLAVTQIKNSTCLLRLT